MRTKWTCEKCLKTGVVSHNSDADVASVANVLIFDHGRKSPECETDLYSIRTEIVPPGAPA